MPNTKLNVFCCVYRIRWIRHKTILKFPRINWWLIRPVNSKKHFSKKGNHNHSNPRTLIKCIEKQSMFLSLIRLFKFDDVQCLATFFFCLIKFFLGFHLKFQPSHRTFSKIKGKMEKNVFVASKFDFFCSINKFFHSINRIFTKYEVNLFLE